MPEPGKATDQQESDISTAAVTAGGVVKAVGLGAGVGALIGVGIAAAINKRWAADVEDEMNRQLHLLLSRANQAAERLRRMRQ